MKVGENHEVSLFFKTQKKEPKLLLVVGSGANKQGARADPAQSSSVPRSEGCTLNRACAGFPPPFCTASLARVASLSPACHWPGWRPLQQIWFKNNTSGAFCYFVLGLGFFCCFCFCFTSARLWGTETLISSCETVGNKSSKLLGIYPKDRIPHTDQVLNDIHPIFICIRHLDTI